MRIALALRLNHFRAAYLQAQYSSTMCNTPLSLPSMLLTSGCRSSIPTAVTIALASSLNFLLNIQLPSKFSLYRVQNIFPRDHI
ncbi:hypothetical protein Pcac1_g7006 [Phytophthora cactorum]|nr:hypothetical protein Pcac1_g7006 [Phytophthora cactorum]